MGQTEMKLKVNSKYTKKECSCGCEKIIDKCGCCLCYSTSRVLIGWRGTGDDDHFICNVCLERLNKINKEDFY